MQNIDELVDLAKKFGLKGLTTLKVVEEKLEGSFLKFMSEEEQSSLMSTLGLKNNDLVIIAASDSQHHCCFGLGAIRSFYAKKLNLIKPDTFDLLWVVHWPMFEYSEEQQRYVSAHHPFTRPCDEDLHLLDEDPSKVYAQAYDIVINGLLSGYKVENSNVCITNNIRSVFVVKPIRCKTQECINCGNCLNYCPVGADPKTGYKMEKCIKCGLCSYICPANINLGGSHE